MYTKLDDSSSSLAVSDISLGPENLKWVTWPWPRPF